MKNIIKKVNASRVNYFGTASFWVCDATNENYKLLKENNINFTTHTFLANDGLTVTRFEF